MLMQSLQREAEAKDMTIDQLEQQTKLFVAAISKPEQEELDKKLKETQLLYNHTVASLAAKMESLSKSANALQSYRLELEEIAGYVKDKRAQLDILSKPPIRSTDISKHLEKSKVGSAELAFVV